MGQQRATTIAEIGENHGGDWELARRMIESAAKCGVDYVKFQSYRAEDVRADDPEKEWFAKVEVPDRIHVELRRCAEDNGVKFLSSPFSVERAMFLVEYLGLKEIKVASSELTNQPLLEYLKDRIQKLYLSTGMATHREVFDVICFIAHSIPEICVMHCVSLYPCPDNAANLLQLKALVAATVHGISHDIQPMPELSAGYSDHTIGTFACIIARALGATVIEKHFTLDHATVGTDHVLSATPEEMINLVHACRRVEVLLGEPAMRKEPQLEELLIRDAVRARFPKTI